MAVSTAFNGTGYQYSSLKAWVDWNNDGVFNNSSNSNEIVYTSGSTLISNMVFGFVVPAGTVPGIYNIRIRNFYSNTDFSPNISPCSNLLNGETEDYSLIVVGDCAAKITSVSDGNRCGSGQVALSVTGNSSSTSYKWYTSESGGTPIPNVTTNTYSPTLNTTTTYYVTSSDGLCESTIRTPVTAHINPIPTVSFNLSKPSICGEETSNLLVTSTGDKEMVVRLNENFSSNTNGGLGVFINNTNVSGNGNTNVDAVWMNKTSTYIPANPPYTVLRPAVASGLFSNKFAIVNADVNPGAPTSNALTQQAAFDTTNFLNLTLTFRVYATFEGINANESLLVQVQKDNGAWITVRTINSDTGIPNRFELITVPLDTYINSNSLKVRFLFNAYAAVNEWAGDIVALDDIKIFGERPLATTFAWAAPAGVLFNSDCTTPYSGNSTTVCIKPTTTMIENIPSWSVSATATLSGGCGATGTIVIDNNSRTFNSASGTDWNLSNLWLPNNVVPTLDNCVIIKKPVEIKFGSDAYAKNIKIQTGSTNGKLNVQGNLTVNGAVVNTGTKNDLIIESDASLFQDKDNVVNIGEATVQRKAPMKKNNYTYWSSPVKGTQTLQNFSPLTSSSRFYRYNEPTNNFALISTSSTFIPGQGYAIMAPSTYNTSSTTDFTGDFVGVLNNGTNYLEGSVSKVIEFPLKNSATTATPNRGYNLVGNPYPSNIDFEKFYDLNKTKIYNTAYFWTNVDPNRPGSTNGAGDAYSGNAYAIYNGTGGVPAATSGALVTANPSQIIKVGQGFIVKSKVNGQNLVFNNTIRSTTGNSQFYSKMVHTAKDRFWLKLTTPANNVNVILIGYIPNATNDYELDYDAPLMSVGSDSFYSVLEDRKLGIQGKSYPLNTDDVVQLATKHYLSGNYTIGMGDREGVFNNGQSVYLNDKELGVYTDLTKGDYTFSIGEGIYTNRFEIVYKPQSTLHVIDVHRSDLLVYRDGEEMVLNSKDLKISEVEWYDLSGKLILSKTTNSKEVRTNVTQFSHLVYIVGVKFTDGTIRTKKVIL